MDSQSSNKTLLASIEDRVLDSCSSSTPSVSTTRNFRFSPKPPQRMYYPSFQSIVECAASPDLMAAAVSVRPGRSDRGGLEAEDGDGSDGGGGGDKGRRRSVLLIIIDKAVAVDNRAFSLVLFMVFTLFFIAICLALFLLSFYFWLN